MSCDANNTERRDDKSKGLKVENGDERGELLDEAEGGCGCGRGIIDCTSRTEEGYDCTVQSCHQGRINDQDD